MPAMRRSNCMRLGVGHPPFVFASNRPISDIRGPAIVVPKRPVGNCRKAEPRRPIYQTVCIG